MLRPFFDGSLWDRNDRLPVPHDDPAREWTEDLAEQDQAEAAVFWQRIGSFKVRV